MSRRASCSKTREEVRGSGRGAVAWKPATVFVDLCTVDLKEYLELITREIKYKEVRDDIMCFVERTRDLFRTLLEAMDVDNHEEMPDQMVGRK